MHFTMYEYAHITFSQQQNTKTHITNGKWLDFLNHSYIR